MPLPMGIKFVASDTSGLPMKRKQVSQACANCRKRKKRCTHTEDGDAIDDSPSPKRHSVSMSLNAALSGRPSAPVSGPPSHHPYHSHPTHPTHPTITHHPPTTGPSPSPHSNPPLQPPALTSTAPAPPPTTTTTAAPATVPTSSTTPSSARPGTRASSPSSTARAGRFVGDLNPEAMFVEAAASGPPPNGATPVPPKKYEVGLWLSTSAPSRPTAPGRQSSTTGAQDSAGSDIPAARPGNMLDRFFLPFIYNECLPCIPPPVHFAALRSLFLRRIHPLFPVIPEAVLFSDTTDPDTIVLKQAVCVAAATHPAMAPHLVLSYRPGVIGHKAPETPLSFQEFTTTLTTAAQAVLQSSVISDRFVAIRAYLLLSLYAQPSSVDEMDLPAVLLGLAMHHTHTLGLQVRDDADSEMIQLYCALWALDKLNAAIYGRPSLVQDHDMSVKITDWISQCPPCFRLMLMIVEWLNKVIELYRPGPSKEASDYEMISSVDLPVLEKLILDADALKVQPTLLATIEILYHAVIIVSCRLPRPGGVTTTRSIPPPSANARRSLAAERISSAISRYSITPIIFVPYAISLSLSVEYRKMRHTRLPMFRARSLAAFRYNCVLLKQYADRFWNARVLAGLGERVIKEMDRIAPDGPEIEAAMSADRDRGREFEVQSVPYNNGATGHPAQNQQQPLVPQGQGGFQVPAQNSASAVAAATTMQQMAQQQPQHPNTMKSMAQYSQSLSMGVIEAVENDVGQIDLDIWNSFGPDFNLDAVDSALEANLDVALPIKWDWMPDTV